MAAAEHGADFPKAKQLRASMTHEQLHDFASGSMKGKPNHTPHPARNLGKRLKDSHDGLVMTNHHRSFKK